MRWNHTSSSLQRKARFLSASRSSITRSKYFVSSVRQSSVDMAPSRTLTWFSPWMTIWDRLIWCSWFRIESVLYSIATSNASTASSSSISLRSQEFVEFIRESFSRFFNANKQHVFGRKKQKHAYSSWSWRIERIVTSILLLLKVGMLGPVFQ